MYPGWSIVKGPKIANEPEFIVPFSLFIKIWSSRTILVQSDPVQFVDKVCETEEGLEIV